MARGGRWLGISVGSCFLFIIVDHNVYIMHLVSVSPILPGALIMHWLCVVDDLQRVVDPPLPVPLLPRQVCEWYGPPSAPWGQQTSGRGRDASQVWEPSERRRVTLSITRLILDILGLCIYFAYCIYRLVTSTTGVHDPMSAV